MNLERTLKSLIKVAAVALTSPATWAVAGNLYVDPVQQLVVRISALILVEGALLLGWHMLDTSDEKTNAQRVLYAVLTITAYFVLWMVAVRHGEGLAGIGFRATLGVLIGYSVFESGILAQIKIRQHADEDITRLASVRKETRKLAKNDYLYDKQMASQETQALRKAEHEARMKDIVTYRDHLLEQIDQQEQPKLMFMSRQLVSIPDRKIAKQPVRMSSKRRAVKQKRMTLLIDHVRTDPDQSKVALAEKVQCSRNTINKYLEELAEKGKLISAETGSGYVYANGKHPVEDAEGTA